MERFRRIEQSLLKIGSKARAILKSFELDMAWNATLERKPVFFTLPKEIDLTEELQQFIHLPNCQLGAKGFGLRQTIKTAPPLGNGIGIPSISIREIRIDCRECNQTSPDLLTQIRQIERREALLNFANEQVEQQRKVWLEKQGGQI